MSINGPAHTSRSLEKRAAMQSGGSPRKLRAASRKVKTLVGTEATPLTLDAIDAHLRSIGTSKATKVLASLVYKLIMRG